MTQFPADAPFGDPRAAPPERKAAPASVLAAPRLPVTRWNRMFLLAGAAVLASVVGLGFYLGLTGREIGRADALALKLVTHCIPAARFPEIEAHLAAADTVDPALDGRHVDPGPAPLMAEAPVIARYFQAASLGDTLARLRAATGADKGFADATLALLAKRSPLALAVTDRMIREASRLDIRGALILDYRLAHRFADLPDFREGVRAFLIDKDGNPRWTPANFEDVTPALLDAFFAPLGADELALPTREAMQAARL